MRRRRDDRCVKNREDPLELCVLDKANQWTARCFTKHLVRIAFSNRSRYEKWVIVFTVLLCIQGICCIILYLCILYKPFVCLSIVGFYYF